MNVETLSIGNELLLGFTVDTNAAFLARELSAAGVRVVRHISVADDADAIVHELARSLQRTGRVITTGGLGPTRDDLSVGAVARGLGRALVEDAAVLESLIALQRRRHGNDQISSAQRKQALVPRGADVLLNNYGTAPGLWMDLPDDGWVAMLPGVPREMQGVFRDSVLPRIRRRLPAVSPVLSRTLRTTGIPESSLAELIDRSGIAFHSLAYLPGSDGVDLRLTVQGASENESRVLLGSEGERLRGVAGEFIYGEGEDDLAAVVLELCRVREWRIATVESCTGGMLGARLTAIPRSSEVYTGGLVTYSNAMKTALADVSEGTLSRFGAVSDRTVLEMAEGARRRLGTEVAVSVSGIAGPGGGSEEKPVGTVWVGVASPRGSSASVRVLPGDRGEVRYRAAQFALERVWKELGERTGR